VTEGSFFVRAERERLGLRPAVATAAGGTTAPTPGATAAAAQAKVQTAKIVINEQGFDPAKVSLRAGTPARLTFIRTTDKTCATEIVFPSLKIKRALPLNEAVEIAFTPAKTGELAFACGMNMLKGVVVVQ
jgi:plastocyanin domain-containing protein